MRRWVLIETSGEEVGEDGLFSNILIGEVRPVHLHVRNRNSGGSGQGDEVNEGYVRSGLVPRIVASQLFIR